MKKIIAIILLFFVMPIILAGLISKEWGFSFGNNPVFSFTIDMFHLASSAVGGWYIGGWIWKHLKDDLKVRSNP